jgi:nucleoside-diphosphate-sugar epimerase
VTITRRDATTAGEVATRLAVRGVAMDLGEARVDEDAIVVVTAPPSGAEARFAAAMARDGARRIVYVSSTGVYAAAGGAWVDEAFPTVSGPRLDAEAALAAGAVPCVRLRAAGIYGPGRGAIARLQAGTYRIVGDGDTHVSRVHVDDLAAAVIAAGDARAPGSVYNVADDDPCTSNELAEAACAALTLPLPPHVPLDRVDPSVAAMFTADRKIDNRRLKQELGWEPRFPSWRTALPSLATRGGLL